MTIVRHPGPVEVGQVWTCRDNDGKLGYRRVRVLAEHPDGGWILEDLPSRSTRSRGDRGVGVPFRCPDVNLRIVFVPEETP